MKFATSFLGLLFVLLMSAHTSFAQSRSKENFEKRTISRQSFFSRIFSRSPQQNKTVAAGIKKPGTATKPAKSQREQADAIWLQQRKFREEQRQKQLNRKPTAWELAYMKQEKQRVKELKKLLKERDKRITARKKSRQKAMAANAKYNQRKLKNTPAKNEPAQRVFTFFPEPGRGNDTRKK